MSSEQARRENVTDERAIGVEKDRVPKMATHFESLAVKEGEGGNEERPGGKVHSKEMGGTRKSGNERPSSIEEVTNFRQQAQQNSADAIRAAAGERYERAKAGQTTPQFAAESAGQDKETMGQKLGETARTTSEKADQATQSVKQGVQSGTEYATEKGQQGFSTAAETAKRAKDYAAETALKAKDTTVDATKKTAGYVGEKAAVAKDATVDSSKNAAGYAAKAASAATDMAAVAAWGTAQYTAKAAAETTKAVAGVASSVPGYTGDKAVAGAGQKAMHYAGDKLGAVKDTVVSTEESAAEYAATKKAEAQRDLEYKKSAPPKAEAFVGTDTPTEKVVLEGGGTRSGQQIQEEGGGFLHAIGETIVEIGQTTKELLVGQDPSSHDQSMVEGGKTTNHLLD